MIESDSEDGLGVDYPEDDLISSSKDEETVQQVMYMVKTYSSGERDEIGWGDARPPQQKCMKM